MPGPRPASLGRRPARHCVGTVTAVNTTSSSKCVRIARGRLGRRVVAPAPSVTALALKWQVQKAREGRAPRPLLPQPREEPGP